MRFLPLFLFFLLVIQGCSSAVSHEARVPASPVDSVVLLHNAINANEKKRQLDTFFSSRFTEGKFSGSILVAQRGVILYEKAFGWKNYEKRDSLTTESAFQLASVSKQFTAAAIMLLHQQGKLQYDDTIGKYLPGFYLKCITIRHLLTHRAGLDKYTNICDNYYRARNEQPVMVNNEEALHIMEELNVRPFRKPDEKFDYSNTGFVILARLVEIISGKSFPVFMQENFFYPLQMKHTWIAGDGLDHPEKTRGYFGPWKCWEDNFLDGVTGDKGVYSTAGDLFTWDRALRNGKILQPEILEEAFAGHSPDLAKKRAWNYGFGWRTLQFDDGAKAVFHNGWWHGFTSTFYRGLTDDVTVIILCNKMNKGIYNTSPVLAILGAHHLPFGDEAVEVEGGSKAP
ncbi:MAG TPA: serine hydrolase domain-containing protein [Bacteroidia bacterium]|nr:serine hydrolase domain-containing protein [Bacteroidia bacterium]